eukprot:scaffold20489_cov159-Amphora_coffeaeformis.AAC.2
MNHNVSITEKHYLATRRRRWLLWAWFITVTSITVTDGFLPSRSKHGSQVFSSSPAGTLSLPTRIHSFVGLESKVNEEEPDKENNSPEEETLMALDATLSTKTTPNSST